MIHAHLKRIALELDEDNFRVQLPEEASNANNTFEDGDGIDRLLWITKIWQKLFRAKLSYLGYEIVKGTEILDVCCGQGFLGESLMEEAGGGVTFCDLSALQLALLSKRFSSQNIHVRVQKGDLMALPFADGEFDLVVGNSFLHHLSNVPQGIAELARVLRPGGRLIIFHEPSINANYWESFPLSLIKNTSGNTGFTDLWQFEHAKLESLFQNSGFRNIIISGSGILQAIVVNWYLIILNKLRIQNKVLLKPALLFRVLCYRIEARLGFNKPSIHPSLLISAEKY